MRAICVCFLWWAAAPSWATDWTRLIPPGQANSPEEFDSYLRVLEAKTPAQVIQASTEFSARWPTSELTLHVLILEMDGFIALGKPVEAIDAGEKALRLAPDNLPSVLVTLANLLPGVSSTPADLKRSEEHARRALRLIETYRVPRSIAPAEWDRIRRVVESQGHAALGLIAAKRDQVENAAREFEIAVSLAPDADATQLYRLAKLYQVLGRRTEARKLFEQVAAMDEPRVRALARQELAAFDK